MFSLLNGEKGMTLCHSMALRFWTTFASIAPIPRVSYYFIITEHTINTPRASVPVSPRVRLRPNRGYSSRPRCAKPFTKGVAFEIVRTVTKWWIVDKIHSCLPKTKSSKDEGNPGQEYHWTRYPEKHWFYLRALQAINKETELSVRIQALGLTKDLVSIGMVTQLHGFCREKPGRRWKVT